MRSLSAIFCSLFLSLSVNAGQNLSCDQIKQNFLGEYQEIILDGSDDVEGRIENRDSFLGSEYHENFGHNVEKALPDGSVGLYRPVKLPAEWASKKIVEISIGRGKFKFVENASSCILFWERGSKDDQERIGPLKLDWVSANGDMIVSDPSKQSYWSFPVLYRKIRR